jgi:hypothetical protein
MTGFEKLMIEYELHLWSTTSKCYENISTVSILLAKPRIYKSPIQAHYYNDLFERSREIIKNRKSLKKQCFQNDQNKSLKDFLFRITEMKFHK